MSTFASDFIEGFDARWSEVNTLIDMAQGLDDGSVLKEGIHCFSTVFQ